MNSGQSRSVSQEQCQQLQVLRSQRDYVEESTSDREAAANSANQRPQPLRRSTRTRLAPSSTDVTYPTMMPSPSFAPELTEGFSAATINNSPHVVSSVHGRCLRAAHPRRGRDSAVSSPSRGDLSPTRPSLGEGRVGETSRFEGDLSWELEEHLLEDESLRNNTNSLRRSRALPQTSSLHIETPSFHAHQHADSIRSSIRSRALSRESSDRSHQIVSASSKRTKTKFHDQGREELLAILRKCGAQIAIYYHTAQPNPEANDIWPNFRNEAKLPARYSILELNQNVATPDTSSGSSHMAAQSRYKLRSQKNLADTVAPPAVTTAPAVVSEKGRPLWNLPVEIVEQIIGHLNRDDVKSLRLVSHELNHFTSQAAFKTVVVPFNTEIYGMLGQESTIDRKGKKRARISRPEYWWKNANSDELYNGHGLDVFRGFGKHIIRFGMSFEVSEDSLSSPPLKSVTEQKTSFWGNYDWPYEEYRRFDAVAGLESAADETPRMKIAFSELTKVKELALSVNSGLGWLNGPDRSIRSRVLQTPPRIFESRQTVPDRRTQARHELWGHIESMHVRAGEDVRLASLYRLEGLHPMIAAQEASLLAAFQPSMPFVDSHILTEAIPHESADCSNLSQRSEDTDMFDGHVLGVSSTRGGVLFTSTGLHPSDAAQTLSPITPVNLSKAQKEWLLETDWAQRAFMSSYMLSIIDNRATFKSIHTLNISSLSDRYISMLNRTDFWDALPALQNVTLYVIPGWRTVEKDPAGFVETPKVDPTDQVDTFCALLQAQIAPRPNIFRLIVGYTASGEHAEGLHARNKLLMPAPILPLRVRSHSDPTLPPIETATLQNVDMLERALVRFPYLQELTLRNCWITPFALCQFVQLHDKYALKHLTLDSVSLTAVLRPTGNVQPANAGQLMHFNQNLALLQQMAMPLANPLHNVPVNTTAANHMIWNGQALNNYIQTLIAQLQQIQANAGNNQQHHQANALNVQLQQQLQNAQALNAQQPQGNALLLAQNLQQNQQPHMQQLNFTQVMQLSQLAAQVIMLQQITGQNVPAPAPGPAPAPALAVAVPLDGATDNNATESDDPLLQRVPREGSWTDIIDQISPGTNLSDFNSAHSKAKPDRNTALESISFVSCGYAKLNRIGTDIDQSDIDAGHNIANALRHACFAQRHAALSSVMMSSKMGYLGEIVQQVDPTELLALDAAWNLRQGWNDTEAARAVEFDGLLAGGTGRFSGKVQRSDKVVTEVDSAS